MAFDEEVKQRIEAALKSSDVVFWEDSASEFAETIGELQIDGVEVLVAEGNEFALKRRVLRGDGAKKLVYRAGGAPNLDDDYLLDIKLSSRAFSCTQASAWGEDAGLSPVLDDTVNAHAEFFKAASRRSAIKELVASAEWMAGAPNAKDLELAMLAVCFGSRATRRVDAARDIAMAILTESAKGSEIAARLVDKCNLGETLWETLNLAFGYVSDEPSFDDFALEAVLSSCTDLTGEQPSLGAEAAIVLSSMAHDNRKAEAFGVLMVRVAQYVAGKYDLSAVPAETLAAHQYLPVVDGPLVDMLGADVVQGVDRSSDIAVVEARRASVPAAARWLPAYAALRTASTLLAAERGFSAEVAGVVSAAECVDAYAAKWHLIDRGYRDFRTELPKACELRPELFDKLEGAVEVAYARYQNDLAVAWQNLVIEEDCWTPDGGIGRQADFAKKQVRASMLNGRTAVVISDALRYECGADWAERLVAQGKYSAEVGNMLSTLPSYTQLGMAALLPHEALSMDPATQHAKADGKDATGTANRTALLQGMEPTAVAFKADDILFGSAPDALRDAKLAYIYHNEIDARGDKRDTEQQAFDAVQNAFGQLDSLMDRLFSAGFATVLVTADHGFLYQQDREQFTYAYMDLMKLVKSDEAASNSRRFVSAPSIPADDSVIVYAALKVGLDGEFEIGVPKGTRRFKLQGSGSRFVHGGMTLQETLVPVVTVRKSKTKGAKRRAHVEIIAGGTKTIGGSTLSFELYQTEPVGGDVLANKVRVALYDASGEAVSEVMELELSSTSEAVADRRTPMRLTLAGSVKNNETVTLRAEVPVGKTSKFQTADEATYKVRRAMGNDFFM